MLLDFLICGSRLLRSVIVEWKKDFLKKSCLVRRWGIFSDFHANYLVFGEWTMKKITRWLVVNYFEQALKFSVPASLLKRFKAKSWSWSLRRSHVVLFTLFCAFFKCKIKSNLVSNIIPRCLWVEDDLTKFSLKYNRGWSIFLLKITSWACFLGSGLNLILYWKSQSLIFIKSQFRSFAVEFIFWTMENR